jgi:hypothetical protein
VDNNSATGDYKITAIYNNDSELESTATAISDGAGIAIAPITTPFDVSLQNGILNLHNNANQPATVSLYNPAGQLLRKVSVKQGETVSVSGLNRGVYFVKIACPPYGDSVRKVVK